MQRPSTLRLESCLSYTVLCCGSFLSLAEGLCFARRTETFYSEFEGKPILLATVNEQRLIAIKLRREGVRDLERGASGREGDDSSRYYLGMSPSTKDDITY